LEHDLELPGIAVWFNVVDFCDIGDSCDRKNLVCRDPFERLARSFPAMPIAPPRVRADERFVKALALG
jgi:hypothetical protein